jgi:DNA (cytosine-5)-methyltransferase 1
MDVGSLNLISLYSGAGGLDLGLEAAGYNTAVAVEFDAIACETLRANRDWPVIQADIHSDEAATPRLLAAANLREGDAALLVGGPPCQPFSKSGFWASGESRRLSDPRASTLVEYLRVLRDTKPRAFLLENVPGLAFSGKSEGLEFLQRSVESLNRESGTQYSFQYAVINAADYGVPQLRQRVFVVGHRDGRDFVFPPATHRALRDDVELFGEPLPTYLTAWDAIGDLEDDEDPALRVSGKWADLLPTIPEGQNYLFHTDRGNGRPLFGWRRRYWSFLLKLAKALPAWTLAAQPGPAIGPFHWKNRRLSSRELCRLQTFPGDYRIVGNRTDVQRQLGNAVASAVAEKLGLAIRAQFFGDWKAAEAELTLLPKLRRPIPMPEPTSRVPAKYRAYEGAHSAHPGTGGGFGAIRREHVGSELSGSAPQDS